MTVDPHPKARRGFSAMDPEKHRAISRLGGASHAAEQRPFSKSRELASAAGRKGGLGSAADSADPNGRSLDRFAPFEGQELTDYRNAVNAGFSAAEARALVLRSRRP